MILRILLSIVAVVFGFFFPGIFGAIVFALILVFVINGFNVRSFNTKRVGVSFVFSFIVGFGFMWFLGLMGASETVHQKVDALKVELVKMGYEPQWFIISQRRNKVYNNLLANSVDASKHLEGKAIDLYIIDINGDGEYDKSDFNLIKQAHDLLQKRDKKFSGGIFDYLKKGFFSKRMVHVQIN
jgi:hypothetical protein